MRRSALLALWFAAACGPPPKPGPQPNVTYFWKLTSSTIAFNDNCSDDAQFRADNEPIDVATNEDTNRNGRLDPGEDRNMNGVLEGDSYLVYKGSADAKQATLMKCTRLDPETCAPADSGVVFEVAGAEMNFATELKTATGAGMCRILDTQTWIMTDKGMTLEVEISDTFSLVDDPMTCDVLEANLKARSPNGMGLQGCTITASLTGTLDR